MKYLLDTNICIYIIRKKPSQVVERIRRCKAFEIGISSITLSELLYGAEKSQYPERNKIALVEFISPFEICPYENRAAYKYGQTRAQLEKKGIGVGAMDMLIAAHALALNLILVTNNENEFKRISGLKIENWTR